MVKEENAGNRSKTNYNFSVTVMLSSANAFNFDQSKILSFGKELRLNLHGAAERLSEAFCRKFDRRLRSN